MALAGIASGSISIKRDVSLECPGGDMALACSNGGMTVDIAQNSRLKLGKNTTFALAYGNATGASISMVDQTSVLHFDGCTFYTSADLANSLPNVTPLLLTKGTVLFENQVRIFNRYYGQPAVNTDMSKAFTLGSGVNARVLGDAYLTVDGCMAYTP